MNVSARNTVYWIALALVIIGGLNWLVIGLAGYDVIEAIFGMGSSIIYVIFGLAAIYLIIVAAWRPGAKPAA